MTKFIADSSFFELFPDAKIGVVIAKGIENNESSSREIKDMLNEANEKAYDYLTEPVFSENKVIKVWRDAFKKFKTKKGARCAIEALLKRVDKGNPVGSINPLVDIYNAVSLSYAIPAGAEDFDKFDGDMVLKITEGGDKFQALGDDNESETYPGELAYVDDTGAICRCFNWRDGVRTMITEDTKNAVVIMESVDPERDEDQKEALNAMAESLEKYLNCQTEIKILTKDDPEVTLK